MHEIISHGDQFTPLPHQTAGKWLGRHHPCELLGYSARRRSYHHAVIWKRKPAKHPVAVSGWAAPWRCSEPLFSGMNYGSYVSVAQGPIRAIHKIEHIVRTCRPRDNHARSLRLKLNMTTPLTMMCNAIHIPIMDGTQIAHYTHPWQFPDR